MKGSARLTKPRTVWMGIYLCIVVVIGVALFRFSIRKPTWVTHVVKLSVVNDEMVAAKVNGRTFLSLGALEQYLLHLPTGTFVYWHIGDIGALYSYGGHAAVCPIGGRQNRLLQQVEYLLHG